MIDEDSITSGEMDINFVVGDVTAPQGLHSPKIVATYALPCGGGDGDGSVRGRVSIRVSVCACLYLCSCYFSVCLYLCSSRCVDDSGVWGSGGVFSALSALSAIPARV